MAQHEAADAQSEDRGGRRDEDDGGHAIEHCVCGGLGRHWREGVGKVCLFIRSNLAGWQLRSMGLLCRRSGGAGQLGERPGGRVAMMGVLGRRAGLLT